MNQATSRRLRKHSLLLLIPFLLAGAPPAPVAQNVSLTGAPTQLRLEYGGTPRAGVPIEVRVKALDVLGFVAPSYLGKVRFRSTDTGATLPAPYHFTEGDAGQQVFTVTFTQATEQTLWVEAIDGPPMTSASISVTIGVGVPHHVRISGAPLPVRAGAPFVITAIAVDEFDNPAVFDGNVSFTWSESRVGPPAPRTFGNGQFEFVFQSARTHSVKISTPSLPVANVELPDIEVLPGEFFRVKLSTATPQPVEACSPAVLQLAAVDPFDNPVREDIGVELCGRPATTLAFSSSNLQSETRSPGCVHGRLSSDGTGQASWSSTAGPSEIQFVVEQELTPATDTLGVLWGASAYSAAHSTLSFSGTPEDTPSLRTFSGQLDLLFEPRNACGELVALPTGQTFAFKAETPLFLREPPVQQADGRWATSVRLPKCPDYSAPLRIWPLVGNELVMKSTTEPLVAAVEPLCATSAVQLSVRSEPDGMRPAPGTLVDLVVELRNDGEEPLPAGVLWFVPQELTEVTASLDGQALTPRGEGYDLPELAAHATLTVNLQGMAGAQTDLQVKATVWYATADGAALTEKQTLKLDRDELGVDVGCGCQTGSLSSQFLPWLALLAAASRSRTRLRRLRRGERIEP
ncbi:hypothetical protein [Hyalangium rubrum]|uniref:DUF11 domain-containing protein n=1 Tax=Hyalangium rubrum TaxID=3103134 RepID=A0ABU5HIB6_9BACT|nr:hypothetical protein [Hyalangium sp. s54d21]MDY7232558.1 hypothetical protein [Hyalangium sp. s54d21]